MVPTCIGRSNRAGVWLGAGWVAADGGFSRQVGALSATTPSSAPVFRNVIRALAHGQTRDLLGKLCDEGRHLSSRRHRVIGLEQSSAEVGVRLHGVGAAG